MHFLFYTGFDAAFCLPRGLFHSVYEWNIVSVEMDSGIRSHNQLSVMSDKIVQLNIFCCSVSILYATRPIQINSIFKPLRPQRADRPLLGELNY